MDTASSIILAVLLLFLERSGEFSSDYEQKKVAMMKAQEDTNMSYQKKKVHAVSLCICVYTCHSVLVGRNSLLVRCVLNTPCPCLVCGCRVLLLRRKKLKLRKKRPNVLQKWRKNT